MRRHACKHVCSRTHICRVVLHAAAACSRFAGRRPVVNQCWRPHLPLLRCRRRLQHLRAVDVRHQCSHPAHHRAGGLAGHPAQARGQLSCDRLDGQVRELGQRRVAAACNSGGCGRTRCDPAWLVNGPDTRRLCTQATRGPAAVHSAHVVHRVGGRPRLPGEQQMPARELASLQATWARSLRGSQRPSCVYRPAPTPFTLYPALVTCRCSCELEPPTSAQVAHVK